MSKLIVNRSRELVNMGSDYIITVNGKKAGRVANGKRVEIKLDPGRHTLMAKVDSYQSKPLEIRIAKGDTKNLKLKSFRFNSWILPAIAVVIPGFHFLYTEQGVSLVYAVLVIAPILLYALYFYTKGKDAYLRWIEHGEGNT